MRVLRGVVYMLKRVGPKRRRRLETVWEKNEAKDSERDRLGIAYGNDVVCL